jgi:plastocyanin
MTIKQQEYWALLITIIVMLGLPLLLVSYSPANLGSDEIRIINLTGVMKNGVWTEDRVTALNYRWGDFKPAAIRIAEGEEIILRLTSADVIHSFYVPELNPEPIYIEAGHIEELHLTSTKTGIYRYYCVTVCGDCHYSMQGLIIVGSPPQDEIEAYADANGMACPNHMQPAEEHTFLEQGKAIFEGSGCQTCHGFEGRGGVVNYNYAKNTVPALNDLADRMKIYWEEDAEIVIKMLDDGVDITTYDVDEPIENFPRFQGQYTSMRMKLVNGAPHVQKADSAGPVPPLVMPSWEAKLTPRDQDAVLAYLISIFDWSQFD